MRLLLYWICVSIEMLTVKLDSISMGLQPEKDSSARRSKMCATSFKNYDAICQPRYPAAYLPIQISRTALAG